MQAGELRHRVTIQAIVASTGDNMGGQTVSRYDDVMTVWAGIDPPKGREYFGAGQTQSETVTRVRIRYRPDITTVNRIKFGSTRYFDINAVINPDERNRELILMCIEVTP